MEMAGCGGGAGRAGAPRAGAWSGFGFSASVLKGGVEELEVAGGGGGGFGGVAIFARRPFRLAENCSFSS